MKDRKLVQMANRVSDNSFDILRWCSENDVSWSIENPAASLLWATPEWRELLEDFAPCKVIVDYCQYGEEWRKRTHIYTWSSEHPNFLKSLRAMCDGGHAHKLLSGWNQDHGNSVPCKGSAVYPEALCRKWATLVRKHLGS